MKKGRLFFTVIIFMLTACNAPFIPAATNIAVPTFTATVPPTPTLTPTPVPTGPCDNPLVPLSIGNQWKYRVTTESGEKFYMLKAVERQDDANIVMLVEFTNETDSISLKESVVCRDGAIENFPLFVMDMLLSDYLRKFFNTYHDTGNYAPAYAAFVKNNWNMEWRAEYLTEDRVYLKNPQGGSDMFVVESSPIHISFQTDGSREAVTVPAGEFSQALKITHRFTMTPTITLPTGGMDGFLTVYTTQWYEPYVGLVRTQIDSMPLKTGMQEFNVPIKSVIELVEFLSGR